MEVRSSRMNISQFFSTLRRALRQLYCSVLAASYVVNVDHLVAFLRDVVKKVGCCASTGQERDAAQVRAKPRCRQPSAAVGSARARERALISGNTGVFVGCMAISSSISPCCTSGGFNVNSRICLITTYCHVL